MQTERIDELIIAWDTIDAMPPLYKAVIILTMLGVSQVEMSEMLNCSQQNISKALKNARILANQLYNTP